MSKEEAAEIIRRTDAFYEKLYNRTLYRLSGVKADYKALDDAHTCCDMDYRYMIGDKDVFDNIRVYDEMSGRKKNRND